MYGKHLKVGGAKDDINFAASKAVADSSGNPGAEPSGILNRAGDFYKQVDISAERMVVDSRAEKTDTRIFSGDF